MIKLQTIVLAGPFSRPVWLCDGASQVHRSCKTLTVSQLSASRVFVVKSRCPRRQPSRKAVADAAVQRRDRNRLRPRLPAHHLVDADQSTGVTGRLDLCGGPGGHARRARCSVRIGDCVRCSGSVLVVVGTFTKYPEPIRQVIYPRSSQCRSFAHITSDGP